MNGIEVFVLFAVNEISIILWHIYILKETILLCSSFLILQLSQPHITTGNTSVGQRIKRILVLHKT